MKTEPHKLNQGVTIYLTVMLIAVILTISFSLTALFLAQTKFLRDIGFSVQAYYAAESGIEKSLYSAWLPSTSPQPQTEQMDNTASFAVWIIAPGDSGCPAGALNYCVKSIGAYKGVQRGIRVVR